MGGTLSRQAAQQAEIKKQWLLDYRDSGVKYAAVASLEAFTVDDTRYLALAYQASEKTYAGSDSQHIRFCLSKDGGDTWSPSRVIMWGIAPQWSPVLYYDHAKTRLFCFYTESRKAYSPGGDIKYITSTDLGATWSAPVTILTHEADGEVPKVIANKPVIAADGTWYLGYHSEPHGSFKTFNESTFTSLKEAESSVPELEIPPRAAAQGVTTVAGVLVSEDGGDTWKAGGTAEDPRTWLIQPSLEIGSKQQLIAFYRTAGGKVYSATSTDKGSTWSKPAPTTLPCPNSKFSSLTIDGQILMAYNPSATERTSLALALSVNDGRSWEPLVAIEDEAGSTFSAPAITEWSDDTVKVVYTVWNKGLKLATIKLATVEA